MITDFLNRRFDEHPEREALVDQDRAHPYAELSRRWSRVRDELAGSRVPPGAVVALDADFSPDSVAWLLGLIEAECIIAPLATESDERRRRSIEVAFCEYVVRVAGNADVAVEPTGRQAEHELYQRLREVRDPGLILFSSGSTGEPKAAVHGFTALLEKFRPQRAPYRTAAFLLFDHIGGINTLFYVLSNTGTVVTVPSRAIEVVLGAIEKHRVELLPTTPTFLNLLLASKAYERYDLSSLKVVTYGTEPMPESTLKRFHGQFPGVRLHQTYGLSEVGILRSKSESSDSLWVRVGGEGFETRIVDGMLQIRAASAMLGYLNAPSPFTEDGWLITHDRVEQRGEFIRFLGRDSEIINVGGEKVYPAEVESVLQEMPGVAEVAVFGERNQLVGQMVSARVTLKEPEPRADFVRRMNGFVKGRLLRHQVPAKVILVDAPQHTERFKRIRKAEPGHGA